MTKPVADNEFTQVSVSPDKLEPASIDKRTIAMAYPDTEMDMEDSHFVYCLPILKRKRRKALHPDGTRTDLEHISGLMLEPALGLRGGYRRLGIFDVAADPGKVMGEEFCNHEGYGGLFYNGKMVVLV
jgi:hypothetical protein